MEKQSGKSGHREGKMNLKKLKNYRGLSKYITPIKLYLSIPDFINNATWNESGETLYSSLNGGNSGD